ncbi:MAG TPA: HigA family addiction module antitoxin [Candidatus Acidoferrales bacterium]|nr:HigA family addiction module antitoxin [Candidatus Acidoferrales bacterium]
MMFNPPHPGEVLREYLGNMSVTETAKHLGVTRAALSRILNGKAGISAEMSLRLSEALGTSPEFWAKMQVQHDLWSASKKKRKKVPKLALAS